MNRICLKSVVMAALCIGFLWQSAAAIGAWTGGKVTKAPWKEGGYQHVVIGNVRYTIMPDVKVQSVFIVTKAVVKAPLTVSGIRAGDTLDVLAEGNRIYQIERKR